MTKRPRTPQTKPAPGERRPVEPRARRFGEVREQSPAPTNPYRYLNKDHSLVLRGDHVIAWDAKADRPAENQPRQLVIEPTQVQAAASWKPEVLGEHTKSVDELKLWREAGSPKPLQTRQSEDEHEEVNIPDLPVMPRPDSVDLSALVVEAAGRFYGVPQDYGTNTAITSRVDGIAQALSSTDDLSSLREQIRELLNIVRELATSRMQFKGPP